MAHLNNAPIGIFDSGVGGLSVYLHLHELLPNEQFIYYADTANVPYGEKNDQQIIELSKKAVEWLTKQGAKLVVVACNSASAYALNELRSIFSIPIVGLVPAIKPACQITKSKKIAVLATRATLNGQLLEQVVNEFALPQNIEIHKHFEPKLVPWVESGMPIDDTVADLLIKQMHLWLNDGVDTLVLGCTHYPFFKDFLQENIDKNQYNMNLIDSGVAIAKRVQSLLTSHNIANTTTNTTTLTLHSTLSTIDDNDKTTTIAKRLIGMPITPIS